MLSWCIINNYFLTKLILCKTNKYKHDCQGNLIIPQFPRSISMKFLLQMAVDNTKNTWKVLDLKETKMKSDVLLISLFLKASNQCIVLVNSEV